MFEKVCIVYMILFGISLMFLCMSIGENRELRAENKELRKMLGGRGYAARGYEKREAR